MKKIALLSLIFIFSPMAALAATFQKDLYFGMRGNTAVSALQEFLKNQTLYSGPVTGNFFSLTEKAVKHFQEREGIVPARGYFGPKTRARANALLSETTPPRSTGTSVIDSLLAKIRALQDQIAALQKGAPAISPPPPAPEPAPAPTPEPEPLPAPAPAPAPIPATVVISNSATSTFPAVETTPYRIGYITLTNNTSSEVRMVRLETIIFDEMDSPLNRNQKINLILRDGNEATDSQISKTEFTFLLPAPQPGSPHTVTQWFPLDISLAAGTTRTVTLWVEFLKYVRSGTLKFDLAKAVTLDPSVTINGAMSLVLTKEPGL